YVPCDNEKLVALMRPLISRDAAIELVEKNIEPAHWDKDNRVRAKKFREMIESSDLEKIISVIKAVYENSKERESLGKKSFILDTGIMQKAEKRLYSELSRALGITEDEASSLFLNL
ncbi:MAG: hypothetical protein IJW38_02130, partial [Clostridia bacterium]|nr:hypothetical protein [Clostridia bacterium]